MNPGTRLGPYEVLAPIGAGGMGEVYRAVDTRLDRQVAIKILPAEFSQNAQLRLRFEREAKAISGLTHPHICTLYDIGHDDGRDYLVLELLEGENLADRLAKGPLPIEQAIRIGAQIAEALDKAHRHGIIHRDLKPGNVMLTKSGAKLLDFGLAKSATMPMVAPDAPTSVMQDDTQQRPLTQEGTIVGTFQYMSPEQLEGRPADARTDIFALGAVLYEMATGKRAFDGKSRASLIATILDRDPAPISSLQPMTPPAFERLVQSCLRKDPDERWQSAHDIAAQLKWIGEGGSAVGIAAPVIARRKRRELAWIVSTLALVLIAVALAVALFRRPAVTAREMRTEIAPPPGHSFDVLLDGAGSVSISPDGRWITYEAVDDQSGEHRMWLRSIDSLQAQPLDIPIANPYPFWSPDSRSLAYFADGKLRRMDIAGGPSTAIADVVEARGGAWGADGTIVYAPHWRGPLWRVSAAGGKAEPLTDLDAKLSETTHRYPAFLPDGEHYLYLGGTHLADEKSELNAIYIGSLKSKERTLLLRARSNAILSAGHLLFVRDKYLLAQPFDAATRTLSGEPRRLADDVHYESGFFRAAFAASNDGTVVFARAGATLIGALQWRDRSGKATELPGEPALWRFVSLSPDGTRVAAEMGDPADVWVYDPDRGTRRRLTAHPLNEVAPLWSPDGRTVVYASDRDVAFDLFSRAADGSGGETNLLKSPDLKIPTSWSPDGRLILFDHAKLYGTLNGGDIWLLPMTGGGKPYPLLQTGFSESGGSFSPDGRWVAFFSDETGRAEVYVTPFPGAATRQQVSTTGADRRPLMWRADGKELFYVQRDGMLMAVPVTVTASSSLETGTAQPLFRIPRLTNVDVSRDGQRFLVSSGTDAGTPPLTIVTGWNHAVATSAR